MNSLKKAITFFLFVVLNTTVILAQVGIGNTNPQKELHIGGNSSTIRVDGLNSINNSNNTGVRDQPVYVDANGDLKIPTGPSGVEILSSNNNFISDGSTYYLRTGTLGQAAWGEIYQSASFTLTQPAVIMVNYSVSFEVHQRDGTGQLEDGKPRLIQNYFFVGDGTTADFSTTYGRASTPFSSYHPGGSHRFVTGYFTNVGYEIIALPAGTHSIHLYGYVFGNNGAGFSRTSDAFSVYYGGGGDTITITAMY